ncbi:MAG: gluconate 2-dehydrogenase subunit 3 family protein [Sandaracinaceae bacterium]|nr:gluconate 2-dehydrogenase subunit 3 family protein [Sandaracinaceae bacterium]
MKTMDRREFIERVMRVSLVGAVGATALPGCASWLFWRSDTPATQRVTLDSTQMQTVASLQNIMLPAGSEFPSAQDVRALPYLLAALADPLVDSDVVTRIVSGSDQLDALSRASHALAFASLATREQEKQMRAFEQASGGRAFLDAVLTFTLEALLGDPVHGGNPNEVGWRAFAIEPGFPRPVA